ncbi:MAG: sulfatase [Phycisphaerae bacterium]
MQTRKMTRRDFLAAAGAGAAGVAAIGWLAWPHDEPAQPPRHGPPPNIVVILADDLGYADLSCHGCKDFQTPHIDSIANSGVRFTQAYVTSPICAPSRAGLVSGRYQQRFGFETNPGPNNVADDNFGLPRDERTFAERLKPLGYTTGIIGKWHLGYSPELTPTQRGFDEFYGFLSGVHPYSPRNPNHRLFRGTEEVAGEKEYLTDAFAREAVAFIRRHRASPFFLYLPFSAVHTPLNAPAKYRQSVRDIQDPVRRSYAAMTIALDEAVGRVLGELKRQSLEENTLVFFLSDNGGATPASSADNSPLRGRKGHCWEGGIRVPFMVQWKDRLPAGRIFRDPVVSLDITPTALAAAGHPSATDHDLDGVDLLPHIDGKSSDRPHDELYWRLHAKRAIRVKDWKMVRHQRQGQWELYNLADDIGESNNLADRMPEKVRELDRAWHEWNAQLKEPGWFTQHRPS